MLYLGWSFLINCLSSPVFLLCQLISNFHPSFVLLVIWSAATEHSSSAQLSHLYINNGKHLFFCSPVIRSDVFIVKQFCCFHQFSCNFPKHCALLSKAVGLTYACLINVCTKKCKYMVPLYNRYHDMTLLCHKSLYQCYLEQYHIILYSVPLKKNCLWICVSVGSVCVLTFARPLSQLKMSVSHILQAHVIVWAI